MRAMEKTIASLGVTVDVPPGSEVTEDGFIFAPDGVELALYADPANTDTNRREVILARCYVKSWGAAEESDAGWSVVFETEDGELGFEIGRRLPDRTLVFWSDRLLAARAREQAMAIARCARLS